MTKAQIAKGFSGLQEYICNRLGDLDQNAIFSSDDWKREEGGGGTTRTIKEGAFIEKGGVAFSKVYGPVTEKMAQQLKLSGIDFFCNRCFGCIAFWKRKPSDHSYECALF
jgi:coproporphyrinogen III oxidase